MTKRSISISERVHPLTLGVFILGHIEHVMSTTQNKNSKRLDSQQIDRQLDPHSTFKHEIFGH